MTDTAIEPFHLAVPDAALIDLRDRLERTRWPERETVTDWSQGTPLSKVQALCDYWRSGYDWRRCEAMLNSWGQYRTHIDGLRFHFFHIRSPEPDALPVIMTHGWPGSPIEFHKVVGPLTDPRRHGGDPADAVHLILPSLPGYGFSDKPTEPGWTVERIAEAWAVLMDRLGYGARWAAQGGDWGGAVTTAIGVNAPLGCIGVHLNINFTRATADEAANADASEQEILATRRHYAQWLSGYAKEQSTRPQTIGLALADSPAGQAAWIYEKFKDWTDTPGDPEDVLGRDEMLDNIMMYWLPNTAASSARLYWESFDRITDRGPVTMPAAFSVFPKEMSRASRRWSERVYKRIAYWNEVPKGGHFAAFEQPDLFVAELRAALRAIRAAVG